MPNANYKYKVPRKFDHVQSEASTTWTITYAPPGGMPVIDVFVATGGHSTKIIPHSIELVSPTEVVVTFTTAYAGVARVVV